MSNTDLITLISSIASLILAIVAIWLSIVFYRLSSQLSESTKEAAKEIGSSVDRLENLFNKLYTDTFSMMRDTYSDMRKHIWPESIAKDQTANIEVEKRAEEKVQGLIKEYQKQFSELLKRQKITDERVSGMTHELGNIMERVINKTRKVENEAREETIREHITQSIKHLLATKGQATAGDIVIELESLFPTRKIISEIEQMKGNGIISYKGPSLTPGTIIY